MRAILFAGVVAVIGLGVQASAAERQARIAYSLTAGGHSEVFSMNADGSGRARLTGTPVDAPSRVSDIDPAWSPDAGTIAFVQISPGRHPWDDDRTQLWLIDADGRNQRPIASASPAIQPAWSPDGRYIAFVRDDPQRDINSFGGSSIRIVATDGSGEMRVSRPKSGVAFDSAPAWSPDGSRIAFERVLVQGGTGAGPSIYSVRSDGSDERLVVRDGNSPAWSPDGTRIAFLSTRDRNGETCTEACGPNSEVYVADADGSNQRRLTYTRGNETAPAWSSDGKRIAFGSDRNSFRGSNGGGAEIYSIAADGSCMTWLTNSPFSAADPSWQPGADLATDPGGCGATPRRPSDEVRPPRGKTPYTRYWLGPSFRNELLTYATASDLEYDDCGAYETTDCADPIELQEQSICARNPLTYGAREPTPGGQVLATRRFKHRGALVAFFPTAGGWDIYTGATTLNVYGADRRQVIRIVDALRPLRGVHHGVLPAPAFPAREFWARLDILLRTYRRARSVDATATKLHISKRTVRDRLAYARLLSSYPHLRRHRCTRAELPRNPRGYKPPSF